MKIELKNIILYFVILSLFLGDLLLYTGILNEFFKDKEAIWAGIIAFIGAIIGGAITYYGVKIQLYSREVEVFMSSASEKLTCFDELLKSLDQSFNFMDQIENDDSLPTPTKLVNINGYVDDICKILNDEKNKEIMNNILDYDTKMEIRHTISLLSSTAMDYEDACKNIELCNRIYNLIQVEKDNLYIQYRKFRSKSIV